MANKIFLLGLFLLSVANVKAQTLTQTDSLTMETMLHNLPEVMVKGSRPIVKAERGMLSYNMPLLLKQLPADNAYEALTRIPGVSDATGSISFSGNEVTLIIWRKRSIPTHSGWLYPLTFDAGKGLKEA